MALDKFNWQNGSQVEPAKVEIEGQSYNVVDAQYEGETPVSASNLNLMQDTILGNVKDDLSDDTKIPSVKAVKKVVLYDSDNPSENANIHLSDSLSNYTYFKVYGAFKDTYFTENMSGEFLVSASNGGRIIICGGRPATNAIVQYYGIYSVSDTDLTFVSLGQITSPTGGNQAKTDGKIKIYRVVAYN